MEGSKRHMQVVHWRGDRCECFDPPEPLDEYEARVCNCHITGPDEFGNRDLIPSGSCPLHG